jgi:GT2 family glycosyltransferase
MSLAAKIVHIFIGWSADHPKVNTRREMYAVTGAAFMTRRNLFREVGGLEMQYGRGTYEDVEYCIKIREMKKKVIYNPLVSGTHHVGGAMVFGDNAGGFNLRQNEQLFMARMGHALEWDEWRHW